MFQDLPADIRKMFPLIADPLVEGAESVPAIVVGDYQDYGANAASPMICVTAEGATEGIVNVYRHITLRVTMWVGGDKVTNVDGRRIVSIIYEAVFQNLCNTNWTGNGISIQRSYEIERSKILFEPTAKTYRIENTYRVEAIAVGATWY